MVPFRVSQNSVVFCRSVFDNLNIILQTNMIFFFYIRIKIQTEFWYESKEMWEQNGSRGRLKTKISFAETIFKRKYMARIN